jgi:hypothetical protein
VEFSSGSGLLYERVITSLVELIMQLASKILQYAIVSLSFIVLAGCNTPIPSYNETVMSEGEKISITNEYGTMTITAGKWLKRCYTWDGETRCVIMEPRYPRWYGSMGLYYPGPGEHWRSNHGITRGVLQEGQMHFDTQEEAEAWLGLGYNHDCIYTSDGLIVCYSKIPERKQINVNVWQIYIDGTEFSKYQCTQTERVGYYDPEMLPPILKELNKKPVYVGGHKPENLRGNQNDKIKVEFPNSQKDEQKQSDF